MDHTGRERGGGSSHKDREHNSTHTHEELWRFYLKDPSFKSDTDLSCPVLADLGTKQAKIFFFFYKYEYLNTRPPLISWMSALGGSPRWLPSLEPKMPRSCP